MHVCMLFSGSVCAFKKKRINAPYTKTEDSFHMLEKTGPNNVNL